MPGPKLFLLDLKLKNQNSNQDPSLLRLTHTCTFVSLHENNNQVIIPKMIQFTFIQLQIHMYSWMESYPNVTIL